MGTRSAGSDFARGNPPRISSVITGDRACDGTMSWIVTIPNAPPAPGRPPTRHPSDRLLRPTDDHLSFAQGGTSRGDRLIRQTTTACVVLLAAIVSYRHMHALVLQHGEAAWTAALLPLSVDGMIAASSMALLADSRHGRHSCRRTRKTSRRRPDNCPVADNKSAQWRS
jgi:Protein of unknown function (DUF2637)